MRENQHVGTDTDTMLKPRLRQLKHTFFSCSSPVPLLGSLGLWQTFGSSRRRRYIEEAELFNIEVSAQFDIKDDEPLNGGFTER